MTCVTPEPGSPGRYGATDQERLNLYRVTRLLLDTTTSVLRRFLGAHIVKQSKRKSLPDFLKVHNSNLRDLLKRKVISKKQWLMIYPDGNPTDKAADWDVTLLAAVLTCTCCLSADETHAVDTIRDTRNSVVAHRKSSHLSNTDFITTWSSLAGAIGVLVKAIESPRFQEKVDTEMREILVETLTGGTDLLQLIYQQLDTLVRLESRTDSSSLTEVQQFLLTLYARSTDVIVSHHGVLVSDVYVSPGVFRIPTSNPHVFLTQSTDRPDSEPPIGSYYELFKPGLGIVYLLGAAGRGKTTFCLRLVSSWCRAVTSKMADPEVDLVGDDRYLYETFDIVLLVCLRSGDKDNTIESMIRDQLFRENECMFTSVSEHLMKQSDRVLVILDGLDEWPGFSDGTMPDRRNLNNCRTLVTTRHTALDHFTVTSVDQLFEIKELDESQIQKLVAKILQVVEKVKTPKTKVEEFIIVCHQRNLNLVMEVPAVLTFLVELWYETGELGATRTQVYCRLLNFILGVKTDQKSNVSSDEIPKLPAVFDGCGACHRQRELIYKLGEFAFDCLLAGQTSSFECTQAVLQEILGNEQLRRCLASGLLTTLPLQSTVSPDNIKVDFFHRTIKDFLAAVFVVSGNNYKSKIQKLFLQMKSIGYVLDCSNVLVFICGLDPFLFHVVGNNIGHAADRSSDVMKFRGSLDERYVFNARSSTYRVVKDVQNLLLTCYNEGTANRWSGKSRDPSQLVQVQFGTVFESRPPPDTVSLHDAIFVDRVDDRLLDLVAQSGEALRSIYVDLPARVDTGILQQAICDTSALERLHLDASVSMVIKRMSSKKLRLVKSLSCEFRDLTRLPGQMGVLTSLTVLSLDVKGPHSLVQDLHTLLQTKTLKLQELELKKVSCTDIESCKSECRSVLDLSRLIKLRRLAIQNVCTACTLLASRSDLVEVEVGAYMNNPSSVFCVLPQLTVTSLHVGGFGAFRWRREDYRALQDSLASLRHLTDLRLVGVRYYGLVVNAQCRTLQRVSLRSVTFPESGWNTFLDGLEACRCKATVELINCTDITADVVNKIGALFVNVSRQRDTYQFSTKA